MKLRFFAGAAVLTLLGSGCTIGEPENILVFGSITVPPAFAVDENGNLPSSDEAPLVDGGRCFSDDGYDDISEGAQVTVKNGAGEIVGLGGLEGGTQQIPYDITYYEYLGSELPICAFRFSFEVPSGQDFYSISIGNDNRGEITYSAEEIAGGIFLTLGG